MKKAEYNKTGTRMIIDTGWKTFDKQVKLISTGNVFSDTQLSLFVRPYSMTECNGFTFPEGHLMEVDLKPFRKVPSTILAKLRDINRRDYYILYEFNIFDKNHHSQVWSYVLTDYHHNLIDFRLVGKYTEKRRNALLNLLPYVSEQGCFC